MKRTFLFVITNLAVLVLLSVVARLLGLDTALARRGIELYIWSDSRRTCCHVQ